MRKRLKTYTVVKAQWDNVNACIVIRRLFIDITITCIKSYFKAFFYQTRKQMLAMCFNATLNIRNTSSANNGNPNRFMSNTFHHIVQYKKT